MPDSFFEVEHSTDIQNSLLKFLDLQDFAARMLIVADQVRRPEYIQKLSMQAFQADRFKGRVHFLSYEQLVKEYEKEVETQPFDIRL